MLNFRNTNIIFLLLLVATFALNFMVPLPGVVYLLLALLYSLILFLGSYFIQLGFYYKSYCSGPTSPREIAISFDDGPAEQTPKILAVLKDYQVEAAFFCIGQRIPGKEELLRQVHDQGHLIGNHSFSHHFWFDLFSTRKMLADLKRMGEVTHSAIGFTPLLFRPPYGVTNPNLSKAVRLGGYSSIGWNIRSLDTVISDRKKLLNKISRSIKPGSIVLFHDTGKATLEILPDFLQKVKSEGYEIVRLDKMLKLKPYA